MWLLSLIALPFKLFQSWTDYKTQKTIVEGQVAQESIRANVELSHIKQAMHAVNMGWWATRWIVPLIAYPVILWWWCVFIDTVFQIPNWSVPAPPEPIYSWSGEIILSFFIVRGGEIVANTVSSLGVAKAITETVKRAFTKPEK